MTLESVRSHLSLRVALAVGLAIHLDWHMARPMDQRLSMGWSAHWLLALPIFLGIAWSLTRRWPTGYLRPALLSVGVGVLLGEVLEPLGEVVLYGDTLAEVYAPDRVWAFVAFLVAGLATLLLSLLAFRRRSTG